MQLNYRRLARPAAAFLIALILLGQGISAPFAKDAEPQSAQWIADIVQHGHWLVPSDYYGFVNRKPPLYYWLSALAAAAVDRPVNEVGARVISLVAGAALATLVLEWSAAMLNVATGWLAFAFLIGSYAFASRAITALTDMLMTLLLFATWCVVERLLAQPQKSWRSIAGAGVLLGLAILTKGPVTLALVTLAVAIECLLTRRNPRVIACSGWPWATLLIAVAIAAAWYVPAAVAGPSSDLAGVFVSENLGHFMPSSMGGTGEAARPVYYIVLRLLSGVLPLSLLLPAVAWSFRSDGFSTEARQRLASQLALMLAVVLLFSAASAKRDDYILPAIPPLAIIFAALFTSLRPNPAGGRSIAEVLRDSAATLIAVVVGLATVGALVATHTGISTPGWASLQSSDASYAAIFVHGLVAQSWPFVIFELVVMTGALATLAGLWRGHSLLTGGGLAAIALAGSILWNGVVRPCELRTRSLVNFAAQVRARAGDVPVYVAYFDPEFAWYYGRGVPPLPRAIARDGAPADAPVYFVARPRELARLSPTVRQSLRTVMRTQLLGGGGPPTLYEITPGSADLNAKPQAANK
ncbi:MAG: ArnT family glycosyltransferase [Candidatus Binataceae bacterium]